MAEHTFAGLTCAEVADLAPAFVLGALEAAEPDAVRRHLADCPEAHAEMAELHSVVPALFEAVDLVAPPAGLKDRILAAAAADTQRAVETRPLAADQARDARRPSVVEDRLPAPAWSGLFRRPVWAAVSLAAALAVVALGVWNVQLGAENRALVAYRNGVVAVLDEAAQPGAQLAVLSAPEGVGPTGLAAVAEDGTVAVVMRNLAPTSGSEVYEAWLIGADGAPVPVGSFVVDASRTATFTTSSPAVAPGVTVALSREPQRGATTPTVVVAVGQAQAS